MPYPFGHLEPKALKQTFLKDVTIVVQYNPVTMTADIMKALSAFAKKDLEFDAFSNAPLTDDGINIISGDNQVRIKFLPNAIHLRLRFPNYKTFNDILKYWPLVEDYLSAQNVDKVTELAVIKYNEIRFELTNKSFTVWNALTSFFTKDLIGNTDPFSESGKSNEELTRWEKRKDFDNEPDMDISINYGFCINPENPLKGELILKPAVCRTNLNISISDAREILKKLNDDAFQAFHWSINNNIFTQLLGKS